MMDSTTEAMRVLFGTIHHKLEFIPGSSLVFNYIRKSYQNDPFRVVLEALLLFFAVRYLTSKKYRPNSNFIELTKKEIDDLIDEWEPEPLIKDISEESRETIENYIEVENQVGCLSVLSNGATFENWSTTNFAGLHNNEDMKKGCIKAVKEYGVGTCGPSGFYGTIDVHLDLQKAIAKTLNVEGAIIYAQSFAAVSSVIPAFSKRGDIIVAYTSFSLYIVVYFCSRDEAVNFAVQRGLLLSRSYIHYFKHNDMKDLRRVLESINVEHKKKKKPLTRRFIVVEGLYQNTGTIVDLPELIGLKEEYKYRLIVDESLSFGSLGPHCLGISDHYNIKADKIDAIIGSFSNSLGAAGGFCAGRKHVVDHQVLSSQAYCYSASLPAFLASAVLINLEKLSNNATAIAGNIKKNIKTFRNSFIHDNSVQIHACSDSPLIHLRLAPSLSLPASKQRKVLSDIIGYMKESGYLICLNQLIGEDEHLNFGPSIKITISAFYETSQIERFSAILSKAVSQIKV